MRTNEKISALDFLMCGGFAPKHLCEKERFLFLFIRKEIAFPAAMSRGDFDFKNDQS
ncbi:MAG TPA: hypothetical protein VL125_00005 [Pelobium sp.]|nr:hypothetical protein [Pelobium sp.]